MLEPLESQQAHTPRCAFLAQRRNLTAEEAEAASKAAGDAAARAEAAQQAAEALAADAERWMAGAELPAGDLIRPGATAPSSEASSSSAFAAPAGAAASAAPAAAPAPVAAHAAAAPLLAPLPAGAPAALAVAADAAWRAMEGAYLEGLALSFRSIRDVRSLTLAHVSGACRGFRAFLARPSGAQALVAAFVARFNEVEADVRATKEAQVGF